jgi:cardiolipin synthase
LSNEQTPHPWKKEQLFFSGDEYFSAVLAAIDQAKNEIFIESYIWDFDTVGTEFLIHLQAARKRGVEIRLLVDGIGSFNSLHLLRAWTQEHKLPLRIYHPLPFSWARVLRMRWRGLRGLLFLFRRINKRNHRKSILIDGDKAYLGSFNISDVHSEKNRGARAWRDTGVFVEGPTVRMLRRAFVKAWSSSRFDNQVDAKALLKSRVQSYPNALIRLNSSIRWRYQLLRDLSKRMKSAQKRILITNAYFLPRKSVLRGLRKAARRGIFVGICIPAKSDVWFVKSAAKSLYSRLISDGVHIFEYQPTILHAKTLIIDDWATVGSHNLNHRSLTHDLEAEAVITHGENIQSLIEHWDHDVLASHTVTLRDLGRWTLGQRLLSHVAYWFRYWI